MGPEVFLAIQLVDVQYGKQHRGAAGARLRAGLPLGLPLPVVGERGVMHRCSMNGWNDFVLRTAAEAPRLREGAVDIRQLWRVELRDTQLTLHDHPSPRVDTPVLLAAPYGRWARMRWNGREHSYDDSWYHEITLNFGGFPSQPDTAVFLGEPDACLDLRRDLLRLGRRKVRSGKPAQRSR